MTYGYTGRICFVDLNKGEVKEEEIDDRVYRRFLGGEGLGVKVLYERQAAKVDPLGSENILGVLPGLLAGCGVPSSGRTMVVTKSPLTGTWGDSNAGGFFAFELKACGYDGIFLKGISPRPVYLFVTDEKIELRDANHLWGKDTVQTKEILCREIGDPRIRVASIGPVGESRSLLSSIIMDDRAAARSGVGAVMGSKRLKSIVLKGKRKVEVADPEAIKAMAGKFIKELKTTEYFVIKTMREYGSCGLVSLGVRLGISPVKNWSLSGGDAFPTHGKLDGENVTKYQIRRSGCAGCPIACGGKVRIEDGPYKGIEARKPEYETLCSFGMMSMNDDVESIFKAQDICDRYGIDTISTGTAIAFAIECFENGLITKEHTGGLELGWGKVPEMLALLQKIVRREGFGAILADGVKKAAEILGKGADTFSVHIGGQELPYHDLRYEDPGRGTAYISDPTPSRHERYTGMQILERGNALGPYPELQPESLDDSDYEGKGRIYARGSKYYEVFSACGLCAYVMGAMFALPLADLISAATGWEFNPSELLDVGERIQTLRQGFNFREGIRPQNFRLPERTKKPPAFQGALKRNAIQYDYEALRTSYFKWMGWNPETGEPSRKRWDELGLSEFES